MPGKQWGIEGLTGSSLTTPNQRKRLSRLCKAARRVLEIGTWQGVTIAAIAREHPSVCFLSIDTFAARGASKEKWKANSGSNQTLAQCTAMDLSVGADVLWDLDVIFVDGKHTYEGCRDDLMASRSMIRDGGVIVVHDFTAECFPGIPKACSEILEPDWAQVDLVEGMAIYRQGRES